MRLTEWLKGFRKPKVERKLPATASTDSLMAALKDSDPSIRKQAVVGLGERGDSRATERIIESLKDRDDGVRLEAVIALGKLGDARAVEPLIEKLKSYDYFYVRKKAAYTLYVFLKQEGLDPQLRDKILSHWRSWYLT